LTVAEIHAERPSDPVAKRLSKFFENDYGNGLRFYERNKHRVRYVYGVGWMYWNGVRWVKDHGQVMKWAQEAHEQIYCELPFLNRFDDSGDDRVKSRFKFWIKSGDNARLKAMLEQAKPHLTELPDKFDADPFLITVLNGTLDLRTGKLKPHDPNDFITRLAPVNFKGPKQSEVFDNFLERILPDAKIREFLQRWFGLSLTGDTSEQYFLFCCGSGANGKTTLLESIKKAMGDYATTIPFECLVNDPRRSGGGPTPELARLPGVRFLMASEPDLGMRFSESKLKTLTGGDTLLVHHKHEAPFELTPTFKLILVGNHKPAIRDATEGIWRRVLMVLFGETIPVAERDPKLMQRLQQDLDEIFYWMVEGCRQWQQDGLGVPEAVKATVEEYRSENDHVGEFLADKTVDNPELEIEFKLLFSAYQLWCDVNGITAYADSVFGRILGERGYPRKRRNTGRFRQGLTLA